MAARLVDLTGGLYGRLSVVNLIDGRRSKSREFIWNCKCIACGDLTEVTSSQLVKGNKKSCGCLKNPSTDLAPNWTGYGEISGKYWGNVQKQAVRKSKTLDFSITLVYAWDVFLKQNRKCAYSGIDLTFPKSERSKGMTGTASLDRINSNVGYVEGNIQWVHKDINKMKMDLPHDTFIQWCHLISRNNNG